MECPPDSKPKLSRSQLMEEILGMRRNSDKKPKDKDPKQSHKPQSVNKTTILPPKQEQEGDQQARMLANMSISRKKQNYAQLKKWDGHRSEELQLHINAVEALHNEVDQLIKMSIDNLETYITFFKERAKCEEKMAICPIIDVRKSIEHNGLAKTTYTNCTMLMNLVYDNSVEEGQRCQLLANTIRKVILKERLDEHSSQSHLNLLRIRERIASLRTQLQVCNAEAEKVSILLVETHQLNESAISGKDFYEMQLSFVEKAAQQTETQKKLGELCLDYMKLAVNEEQKRRNVLKQCLNIYIDAMKYAYNVEKAPTPEDYKESSMETISKVYSLQNLVDGRILNLIKLKNNFVQMTISHFQKYLTGFAFQEFNGKLLLLKEYNVFHEAAKNRFESCCMVVTVDRFLHCFFNPSGLYSKPSVTFKVDNTLVIKSESEVKISIKKKDQRKKSVISYIIWDAKTEPAYHIQFAKRDTKEEFCVFLRTLI